jgi:hypothetical protein
MVSTPENTIWLRKQVISITENGSITEHYLNNKSSKNDKNELFEN